MFAWSGEGGAVSRALITIAAAVLALVTRAWVPPAAADLSGTSRAADRAPAQAHADGGVAAGDVRVHGGGVRSDRPAVVGEVGAHTVAGGRAGNGDPSMLQVPASPPRGYTVQGADRAGPGRPAGAVGERSPMVVARLSVASGTAGRSPWPAWPAARPEPIAQTRGVRVARGPGRIVRREAIP